MFSPRLLAVFALVAVAAAIPATDRPSVPLPITTITDDEVEAPWLSFPLFGNFFAPLWQLFPKFTEIGPRIVADYDKFQVVVNVKGYKKGDLKVKVKGDFIFIQGSQEAKQDDRDVFASQFIHTYTLPTNSSSADVTAELYSDDYLVVTAPLNGAVDKTKEVDRELSIVETGKPFKDEKRPEDKTGEDKPIEEKPAEVNPVDAKVEKVEVPTPTPAASTTVTVEEDRKEPTTPAEQEDVTEKDNDIPHGNEIQP